jgi:hypothetical protein
MISRIAEICLSLYLNGFEKSAEEKKKSIPIFLLPLWAFMASSELNSTCRTNLHSPGLRKVVQGWSYFHMTAARAWVRVVNQHHTYWKKNPTYVQSSPWLPWRHCLEVVEALNKREHDRRPLGIPKALHNTDLQLSSSTISVKFRPF